MSLTVTNGLDFWLSVSVFASVISDTVTDEIDGRLSPVSAMSVAITELAIICLFVDSLLFIDCPEIEGFTAISASGFDKAALVSFNCLASAVVVDGVNLLSEEPDDWLDIDVVAPVCEADGSVSVVTDSIACSDLSSVDSVAWSAHTERKSHEHFVLLQHHTTRVHHKT